MKVSVPTSTNRPTFWRRFCEALSKNSVELEVIMVGPFDDAAKEIKLPIPVRYIQSNANPTLAWEIGARQATGDFLSFGADDFCLSPGFLDDAVKAYQNLTEFDMIAARYYKNNEDLFGGMRLSSIPDMPLTPVHGVVRASAHKSAQGIDRRFHAVLWDADLYMRFYQAGGRTTLLEGHRIDEIDHNSETGFTILDDTSLFTRNCVRDHQVLSDMWFVGGRPQLFRNAPVAPYSEEETRV